MRVHVYTAGSQSALTHPEVPPGTRLVDLVVVEAGEIVYRVGGEAEIDIELTVVEIFGLEPGHVIVHHCRQIAVTIAYAGSVKEISVHPSTHVQNVRAKAVAAFGVDETSSADLILRLQGSTDELTTTTPIGAYVPKGTCSLTLDLVHLVRAQG